MSSLFYREYFSTLNRHLGPRAVLIMDCPLEWTDKSFQENDIFSVVKIVGSAFELSAKGFFALDKANYHYFRRLFESS